MVGYGAAVDKDSNNMAGPPLDGLIGTAMPAHVAENSLSLQLFKAYGVITEYLFSKTNSSKHMFLLFH